MTAPFLDKVAGHIFQNYQENISALSIILPNKRAGLFLKKYLAEKFRKNIWSPKIYSIEEFISELSGVTVQEPLTLLFELYNIYQKAEGENAQKPDEFIRWANVLLNDFNEIDRYCVNAAELFSYLNEIRAIELWNPQSRELSEFQKQYLKFWKSLGILYKEFSTALLRKNQAYQGLAYKLATEKLQTLNPQLATLNLFVGFNALSKAEEFIIQHFLKEGKGEILWDSDKYYMENGNQEAGKFLRKNISGFPAFSFDKDKQQMKNGELFRWQFDILSTDEKSVEIIGVSGNVAQAKAAGEIISYLDNSRNYENTAVVLADESLLIPMLNSLPEKVESVNVTMGYPLKNSPLHDFWNALFYLHENSYSSSGAQRFYHKNVIHVLSHPFLAFSEEMISASNKIVSEIKVKNRIYISVGELSGTFKTPEILKIIFSDWNNNPSVAIQIALNLIKQRIREKNMEAEFLARYLEIFNQIQSLIEQYHVINDLRTLRIIFNQIAGSYTVPFSGEPLKGLQIMGVLETRTLDFETVILLSANEDVLPSGKSQNSFIPFDVKKQFGLPTYSDRDAIFAYHFYRLIQRAKNIFLLYNNDTSKSFGMGGSEKSRFITQIQEELPKINPKIKITEKILSFPIIKKSAPVLSIAKNEQILMRLDKLAEKGFSPTAINTFLNCPLDFYFKYIIGLREEEEVEETIEAATFGDFIHAALQNLYSPFIGKDVLQEDVLQMKIKADGIVKAAFLEEFSEHDINFGKNLLTLKVAQKFVASFLNKEIELLKNLAKSGETLTILDLEKEMNSEISVNGKNIKIRGKADRIDKIGNITRIIDYKTGKVQPYDVKIESAEITLLEKQKPKALQLLMYALIFTQSSQNPSPLKLQTGIISMKRLSEEFMPLMIDGNKIIEKNSLNIFEKELEKIIAGMYNPAIVFEHNEDAKYCAFCQ